ncbi:hypothetical protein ABMY26_14825 [Azospirillum sp. HJ39]|uniref:hypothetical protein n=1 Tax=Azospirillum sp. HJ39 TaxID=3159496 RepID=UPI00355731A1
MSSIDTTAPRPDHPWLADFEAAPAESFDAVIRGVAVPFPYSRGEPREALALLFGGLAERDPLRGLLDRSVGAWIDARRLDKPAFRVAYGIDRYVQELSDALHLVYRLELGGTARRLAAHYFDYLVWLRPLRLNGARDPLGEFWTVLARNQTDRRFLSRWYRLCDEAGRDRSRRGFGKSDIATALLGLRRLPDDGEEPAALDAALAGLARWGALLGAQDAGRFRRQWLAFRALYPRGPAFWAEHVPPLLKGHQEPFADWWREGLTLPKTGGGGRALQTPPLNEVHDVLNRIGVEPVEKLRPDIERLIAHRLQYAEATGISHFVVRTACNIGDRVLAEAPDLTLRLAHIAVRWEPENPFGWTLWSKALLALGQDDLAELLLWDCIRRFPDNDVSRAALAELLGRTGREGEAEALYRATMARFPDDVVSRDALADLLGRTGREGEAEALYRATMARFPDNVVSRAALADLLGRTGREAEAEALYRATMARFPDNVVSRDALVRLLIRRGRPDDAERAIPDVARLDRKSANALAAALARARRGEDPFPEHETAAPLRGAVAADDAAEQAGDDGRVMRIGFRLGPALAPLAEAERIRLRAAAAADLSAMLERRPDHAGAALLSLRQDRAAAEDRAARWAPLGAAFPHDYGFRLDLARRLADREAMAALLDDFPRRAAVTRLARWQSGTGDAQDIHAVADWLADHGENDLKSDPMALFVWHRLTDWMRDSARPLADTLGAHAEELAPLLSEAAFAATQEAVPLVA